MNTELQAIYSDLLEKHSHQKTFLQTVKEVYESIDGYVTDHDFSDEDYHLIRRMTEPERIISFKVTWTDDEGKRQINTGYRVQFNSALGPYKGGLRFDPSVNEDVLKFLGFEQIFKNSLTGLRLGGGKGGSDFDPRGRSDNEIRSFCRAFILELYRHIGIETDVPAGDIGVGGREIGYMYGMYKEITNRNEGVLTGKDELFGGSCRRTEATGNGVVYFTEALAKANNIEMKGLTAVVSGAGNVASHTAKKLTDFGVKVMTMSDRCGFIFKEDGLTHKDVDTIVEARGNGKNMSEIVINGAVYKEGKPWQQVAADAYFSCATQNEVSGVDARAMIKHAKFIVEGANMPLDDEAVEVVRENKTLFAPGKAANAGGVTVSGIEMAQNAAHYAWSCEEVEAELKKIMGKIHDQCVKYGKDKDGNIDYVNGANIAGFARVFEAMKKLGW
tara:strand:+ start:5666 stop:6997 length:1332 start_codon:yes stop_codon:yes gene_type:complete